MLQHVTLEIRREQLDACLAFWELLGFQRLVVPGPLRGRFFWVGKDGTQIHLAPVADPVVPPRGHTAVVGDPEPLRAAGFALEPGSDVWAPRWFTRDPAGHRVEIMSAPPPSDIVDE